MVDGWWSQLIQDQASPELPIWNEWCGVVHTPSKCSPDPAHKRGDQGHCIGEKHHSGDGYSFSCTV